MIISGSKFRTFADHDLRTVLESQKEQIRQKVRGDEDEAKIDRLVNEFRIEPIIMDESGIFVSDREEMIPAEWFPGGFFMDPGRRYAKKVVRYHIPFAGERQLLRCKPSTFILRTEEIAIDGNEIVFDIISWSNDPAPVKSIMEDIMKYLREQNEHVAVEVRNFNEGLRAYVVAAVAAKKKKNEEGDAFVSSLGVPRKPHGR